ncbi:flavodoxin family protein [Deltaproteobacteria bacterium OttesenSCG-928-K17]|nr:flavodoxin family protein [Deltaproteobacteria bacterium OttesenSCG-928-K17]
MDILSLHLSPRKDGNSADMMKEFLRGARDAGAEALEYSIADHHIKPCLGCGACEKTGTCVIRDDDMKDLIPLLAKAPMIVVATSLFFYDVPAQGKALIDRTQPLWSWRYRLGRTDSLRPKGQGFLLALGATKGQDLFVPVALSVKYFFDSIGFPKTFESLFFRQVENLGDMAGNEEHMKQLYEAGKEFGAKRPAA